MMTNVCCWKYCVCSVFSSFFGANNLAFKLVRKRFQTTKPCVRFLRISLFQWLLYQSIKSIVGFPKNDWLRYCSHLVDNSPRSSRTAASNTFVCFDMQVIKLALLRQLKRRLSSISSPIIALDKDMAIANYDSTANTCKRFKVLLNPFIR